MRKPLHGLGRKLLIESGLANGSAFYHRAVSFNYFVPFGDVKSIELVVSKRKSLEDSELADAAIDVERKLDVFLYAARIAERYENKASIPGSTAHRIYSFVQRVWARLLLRTGLVIIALVKAPHDRRPPHAKSSKANFPRFWELFGYVLPPSIKRKAYEPYVEEMKEDYLVARSNPKNRRKWPRRWLWFCFFIRTFAACVTSLRLFFMESCWKWLAALLPSEVKDWFRRFTGR